MTHILVVDDSPTELHVYQKILSKHGYTVSVAANGEEGVKKAQDEAPDLIFMDVVMPVLNGFQATRELTRNTKTSNIPVVMVTSKDQETDMLWAKRQGAEAYLVKPAKEKQLLACINNILGKR
ncbi:MAG: response regulator [bacterium]